MGDFMRKITYLTIVTGGGAIKFQLLSLGGAEPWSAADPLAGFFLRFPCAAKSGLLRGRA